MSNATSIQGTLDLYCDNSCQLIFFSLNTRVEIRENVCSKLNIMSEALSINTFPSRYLPKWQLHSSIERVVARIPCWNEKTLSISGKEVLLKAIVHAIPTYVMSVFKIPKNICKEICNAIARFWWGGTQEKKKLHWKAWWKMCIPKKEGRMGFRDLHCFNQALLAKQCWRLLSDPDSLCAQVLRAKHYPNGDLLNTTLRKGASFTWQSIMSGLKTFKRGSIWRPGNGESINIWSDQWIPSSHDRKIMTPRGQCLLTLVKEIINPVTGDWDEELLRDNFWPVDV